MEFFFVPSYYGQGPNIGFSQGTPWVTTLNGGLKPFIYSQRKSSWDYPAHFQMVKCGPRQFLGGLTDVGFGLNPVPTPSGTLRTCSNG